MTDLMFSTIASGCEPCCDDPAASCPPNVNNFDDGTFGTLPHNATTPPWSVVSGELHSDGSGYAELLWTKGVEDVDVYTRHQIEADLVGEGGRVGQGVLIKMDAGTATLRIADGNILTLEFLPIEWTEGQQPFYQQTQLGNFVYYLRLGVYVDHKCGIRFNIVGYATGSNFEVVLGFVVPVDITVYTFPETIQAGVLAYPNTQVGTPDPCCPGFNYNDSFTVDHTEILPNGYQVTISGTLQRNESGYFVGIVTVNDTSCTDIWAEEWTIHCDGTNYILTLPIPYAATYTGSIVCNSKTLTFSTFESPISCSDGYSPKAFPLEFLGASTGESVPHEFDNVRISSCAGLPPAECPRASCGDWGPLPLKMELVIPATIQWKPGQNMLSDGSTYPADYLTQFSGTFHLLLQPHVQADPTEFSGDYPYRGWNGEALVDSPTTIDQLDAHVLLREWIVDTDTSQDILNPPGYPFGTFYSTYLNGPCAYSAAKPVEGGYAYATPKHWVLVNPADGVGDEYYVYSLSNGSPYYRIHSFIGVVFSKKIVYEEEVVGNQVIQHLRHKWEITAYYSAGRHGWVVYYWSETKDPEVDPGPPTIGSHTLLPHPEVYNDTPFDPDDGWTGENGSIQNFPDSLTITTLA